MLTRYLSTTAHGPPYDPESQAPFEYDPTWLSKPVHVADPCGVSTTGRKMEHTDSFSETVIELGSGMGTVGLTAAEVLRRVQLTSSCGYHLASGTAVDANVAMNELAGGVERVGRGRMRSANVVLTDLPDVCTLLRENVSVQLEEWKRAKFEGLTVVDEENVQPIGEESVDIRVRQLSWGNEEHLQNLSRELRTLHHSSEKDKASNLTILCSDLVCLLFFTAIETHATRPLGIAAGILPSPSGPSPQESHPSHIARISSGCVSTCNHHHVM